jgi:hypothetical protein
MTVKNSCRFHALVIVRAMETNGEQLIRRDGKPYTHSGRLKVARLLRYHAAQRRGEAPLEADGFNRDQALYAYRKVFKTGRAFAADLTPAEMKTFLRDGWAMTVSGNVDSVPASSPLDDFVNDVPHEIAILPFPNDYGPLVDESMRPRGAGLIRVSWAHLNRFTSEFKDGRNRRHCVLVKAGWDTAKARATRDRDQTIAKQKRTIARVREARDDALGDLEAANDEIARLEQQTDPTHAKAAGWESALVAITAAADELRTDGPPE